MWSRRTSVFASSERRYSAIAATAGLRLNGKPIYLNGTLDQSFHQTGYFTYPTDDEMQDEIYLRSASGLTWFGFILNRRSRASCTGRISWDARNGGYALLLGQSR